MVCQSDHDDLCGLPVLAAERDAAEREAHAE